MSFKPLVVLEKNRVCHVDRLGSRLDERVIGATVIYIGLEQPVTVLYRDVEPRIGRIIAVQPYRRHRIVAGRQYVCTVLVEPESVTDECLQQLVDDINGHALDASRLTDLLDFLVDSARDPARLARSDGELSFDQLVFKRDLEARSLDQRIAKVADLLERKIDEQIGSNSCAREITLSASHFLRLFRESTGVQFRHYRMWKRARTWLHHIKTDASLTQIALNLGYPDSTHFSHSIRQTYGLPPRAMKNHMQQSIFVIGSAER